METVQTCEGPKALKPNDLLVCIGVHGGFVLVNHRGIAVLTGLNSLADACDVATGLVAPVEGQVWLNRCCGQHPFTPQT